MKLSIDQENQYLNRRGVVCPFCKSTDIEAGKQEANEDTITQEVKCKSCKKEWTDVYQLIGISQTAERTTDDVKNIFKGFNFHRVKTNPSEQILANLWSEFWYTPLNPQHTIDQLNLAVDASGNTYLTEREFRMISSIIQWLGSPVGKGFVTTIYNEIIAKEK